MVHAQPKADTARRLVAASADILIALLIYEIMSWLAGRFVSALAAGAFLLLRDSLLLTGAYQASPGKNLLHMHVRHGRNKPCDHIASIKRNLPLAAYFLLLAAFTLLFHVIPFVDPALALLLAAIGGALAMGMELYKLLTDDKGLRLGDLLADTWVVENIVSPPESGDFS